MADYAGVLVVFTAKTIDQILKAGGTQSWVLNQHSMRDVEYAVCTRNTDPAHDEECGVRSEQHNAAFLVGKICGMTKVGRRSNRDRYRVDFSAYALVTVPGFRHGSVRNPVTYSDVNQCANNGIDIAALDFRPMPQALGSEPRPASHRPDNDNQGLTIPEAKKGLSIHFNVPTESIQITISG